ncbi:hypothetical protein WJX73_001547 [Symbiochloris irregularis]|uniref:MRG domain-containing protein n=1 Tax=Symbiochloris irregularis TaxID=706552 RepID=A0AAW1PFB7_9CHLO
MPKDSGPFRTGQRVLIPFTDKFYTAKCIKAEKREDGVWYYLVHYQGWNKSHDEWIEQQGLQPFDPDLAKVNLNKDEQAKQKPKKVEKKRKSELTPWDGDQQEVAQVRVPLPPLLQKVLLDDRDRILEQQDISPVPARLTVAQVLQSYVSLSSVGQETSKPYEEAAAGLRIYFDKALQQHLLYEEEQDQAEQALSRGRMASCLWGPTHLLRLLCKLPTLMPMAVGTT